MIAPRWPLERPEREGALVAAPVIALYTALYAALVHHFGVNVLISDEWSLIPFVRRIYEGGWERELFSPLNEHRMVTLRLLLRLVVPATDWNTVALMYCSVGFSALSLWGLWRVFRASSDASPLWFLPIAGLFTTLSQYQNLFFGMQVAFVMLVTGAVWTLAALARPGRAALGLGVLAATFTTFSLGNGPLIWPAGLVVLLCRRASGRALAAWLGSAALVAGLICLYTPLQQLAQTAHSAQRWAVLPGFTLAFLGAPLGLDSTPLSIGAGALLLGALLALAAPHLRGQPLRAAQGGPLGLVVFALLCALAAAAARAGFGVQFALTSRYIAFSVLGWIGAYLLGVQRLGEPLARRLLLGATGVLVAFGVVGANWVGWDASVQWTREYGYVNKLFFQTHDTVPLPPPIVFHPDHIPLLDAGLPFLRERGLSFTRDPVDWWLAPNGQPGNTALAPLTSVQPISQTFACPVETLRDISALVASSGLSRHSAVELQLYDAATAQPLARAVREIRGKHGRKRVALRLPQPLRECRGRSLRFELRVPEPSAEGQLLGLAEAAYYTGELHQGEQPWPGQSLVLELNTLYYGIRGEKLGHRG